MDVRTPSRGVVFATAVAATPLNPSEKNDPKCLRQSCTAGRGSFSVRIPGSWRGLEWCTGHRQRLKRNFSHVCLPSRLLLCSRRRSARATEPNSLFFWCSSSVPYRNGCACICIPLGPSAEASLRPPSRLARQKRRLEKVSSFVGCPHLAAAVFFCYLAVDRVCGPREGRN